MLFNSYIFLLGFLPVTLALYFGVFARLGLRWALGFLAVASLGFYAWWNPIYVGLIILSMLGNYSLGHFQSVTWNNPSWHKARTRWAVAGVAANLALLAYYKYANFFVDSLNGAADTHFVLHRILLPLGVSFFTFEQVGYVVDAYRGKAREYSFIEYAFFVTFFPHLIAGPIIMHHELLGQVRSEAMLKFSWANFSTGLTLFVFGLFKKVVVADPISGYATPVFGQVSQGHIPTAFQAWLAIFAYSLQLYFDFSGYSDMAMGLAQMLNLRLPLNFNSPYKAINAIDFWRRWHMTLSRFLRDYLYIPLGGNRGATWRRYVNLELTMLLGGLWHGAGWGFVIWGGLNGLFQIVNLTFRAWRGAPSLRDEKPTWWAAELGMTATFVAIMLSRVFFRAVTWHGAVLMVQGLAGAGGGGWHVGLQAEGVGVCLCVGAYLWTRYAPNSHDILAHRNPACPPVPSTSWLRFQPSIPWAATVAAMGCAALLCLSKVSEFLYFQF